MHLPVVVAASKSVSAANPACAALGAAAPAHAGASRAQTLPAQSVAEAAATKPQVHPQEQTQRKVRPPNRSDLPPSPLMSLEPLMDGRDLAECSDLPLRLFLRVSLQLTSVMKATSCVML